MKPNIHLPLTICLVILSFQFIYTQQISQEEYALRRSNVIKSLKPNTVVAMRSAEYQTRGGDVNFPYRQESNFLYLTGLQKANSYLIVTSNGYTINGKQVHSMLFTYDLSDDSVIEIKGNYHAFISSKKFKDIFQEILKASKILYFSAPELFFVNDWLNNKPLFIENESKKLLKKNYPDLGILDAASLLNQFREIKSETELEIMKKAADITSDGLSGAISICEPGMFEYELKAAIEYQMVKQGAMSTSFPSIIGSGPNALILHYDECTREMEDGDLVVMDVGAEYNGYAADITRTIPVNGKFSSAQRELYELILKARNKVLELVRPGVSLQDLHNKSLEVFAESNLEQYMPYFLCHHVGVDVHDPSSSDTLRAGIVFTVEPGLYIPVDDLTTEPKFRGMGIRIEDDVLVTETGYIILTDKIPVEADEIEELMD